MDVDYYKLYIRSAGTAQLSLSLPSSNYSSYTAYNRIRRHAKIGNQVPADFDKQFYANRQQSAA